MSKGTTHRIGATNTGCARVHRRHYVLYNIPNMHTLHTNDIKRHNAQAHKGWQRQKSSIMQVLTLALYAACEWVTDEPGGTSAYGIVIHDLATCIYAASARAGVHTFLVDTCTVECTFGADDALRSTCGWSTDITGQATACTVSIAFTALTIGSTR